METKQQKAAKDASKGLKKLTEKQMDAIRDLWERNDAKLKEVEKLVNKSVLYKITGDTKYQPKLNRNIKAEQLNSILFT